MQRRFLAAGAAALALASGVASAQDVTFTWDYSKTVTGVSSNPDCAPTDTHVCSYQIDTSGLFNLTLPDNTTATTTTVLFGDATETIAFQTSGGTLVSYDLVDDWLESSYDSYEHLHLTESGGSAAGYATDMHFGFFVQDSTVYAAPIPEPSVALLLVAGLGIIGARRRQLKTADGTDAKVPM